jgi:Uma2 family endonuclease
MLRAAWPCYTDRMAELAAWPAIEPHLVRPLKRSEYDRMIELGMFEQERVELIRGVLVKMSPQRAPHASTIGKLTELLAAQLRGQWRLRIQLPLALSEDSEPEPDVAVVGPGNYDAEHPTSALLVIEVAETTLRTDRNKAAVYASSGVGEYWIVNLDARTVEVYSSPDRDRYAESRTLRVGDTLHPLALAGVSLEVADILPTI